MPTDIMAERIPCDCTDTPHADWCAVTVVDKLRERVSELEQAARPFAWIRPYHVDPDEQVHLSVSGAQMRQLHTALGTPEQDDEGMTTYALSVWERYVLDAVTDQTRGVGSGVTAPDLTSTVDLPVREIRGHLRGLHDAGLLLEFPGVGYRLSDAAHDYVEA